MAKQESTEFLLQECEFEIDEDGYFSGFAQYQLTNIPNEGLVVQAYLEMSKAKSLALVSEISDCYFTESDDTLHVSVSGSLDGNALPDSFALKYRLFKLSDSIETKPDLPSSFGEQKLSTSPTGLLGGKKWKSGGGREVISIMVHNDAGDFSITTTIDTGKTGHDDIAVVVENRTDGSSEQFVISRAPIITIKNQYTPGAETLVSNYRFYKPEKWSVLGKNHPFEVMKT